MRIQMMRTVTMIQLINIRKFYTNKFIKTHVLRGINFDIKEGEFVTVMGPSGAGKSTLLNIIGMLDSASGGEYYFQGNPVHHMGNRKRTALHQHNIGFIFQAYHLIDDLTVYQNLETPLTYKKVKKSARKPLIESMAGRFNLDKKLDLYPYQLSGGEQQMVGIARALIIEPRLLLADEPTGNLNSQAGLEVMNLLKKLNKDGMTIIQVTHDDKKAAYGTRIIHLLDGLIETEETVTGKRKKK
jgi:ABC-type lipoprotein export system ATPase subunit